MQKSWDWSCDDIDLVKIRASYHKPGNSASLRCSSFTFKLEFKVCHWISGWLWNVKTWAGRIGSWIYHKPCNDVRLLCDDSICSAQWRDERQFSKGSDPLWIWWQKQPCEVLFYFFIEPHHIPLWCLELHALQYIDEFIRTAWWFEWNEIKWNVTLKARKPKCLRD